MMLKFFNRQKSLSKIYKKNYTIAPDYNHYRDVRLHDKFAKDIIQHRYSGINMSSKVNDIISNSLVFTYKDYRNHLLQAKYAKN